MKTDVLTKLLLTGILLVLLVLLFTREGPTPAYAQAGGGGVTAAPIAPTGGVIIATANKWAIIGPGGTKTASGNW